MNAITHRSGGGGPLRPTTFAEMERFAAIAARSGMVPTAYAHKPEAILIAVQLGSELGLAPMQALQSVAVIQGRPAVYGDAMPGLVRASGICAWIKETIEGTGDAAVATCASLRKGDPEPTVRTFSVNDAKKAGLWNKGGPWTQYPLRMLAMRARSWCLRDAYPDVLRGLIAAEEAQDIPADQPRREPPHTGTTIEAQAEPAASSLAAEINDAIPTFEDLTAPITGCADWKEWGERLRVQLEGATTAQDVETIAGRVDVKGALAQFKNGALTKLNAMIKAALDRTQPAADDDGGDFPGIVTEDGA